MADRPDRTATQFPTVTGNRPDRNKDEGGGIALLLLGGGLLGWGIYEATKQKCPSGYTLVNGLCVAPSSSSSSESSNSSSSSASPPPSSSSSGPVGVCATELGTVLTALPFYWSSLSAIGQLVNTEFAMLLNRWPCGEGYTSFNWTDVYNAPCCGYTPIQMVAMRIVTDQAGEFLQDVQALANTYLAGGAFAGNPNPAEDCFIAAAFNRVFNRTFGSPSVALMDAWRSEYETNFTDPGGEFMSGPVHLLWQFVMQPEFTDRVTYNIGNPLGCSPGVTGCGGYT